MHLLNLEGCKSTPGRVTKGQAFEKYNCVTKRYRTQEDILEALIYTLFDLEGYQAPPGRVIKGQAFEKHNCVKSRYRTQGDIFEALVCTVLARKTINQPGEGLPKDRHLKHTNV